MIDSIEKTLLQEVLMLRNENQMLKEQLSQANINSETIHNNSSSSSTVMDEEMAQRRKQLLDMLEPTNHETEDEYNNMSIEDIAKGYEEMGNIMLQENLELSQNN